jgi:hypothetical protein
LLAGAPLCRRLVREQLYTAATTGGFSAVSGLTGLLTFVSSLAGHVAGEAARIR